MIINFCNKRNFFRTTDKNTVFICGFDLLYQYAKLSLGRFIKYYPGIKNTLKTKKFGNNTCRMFRSEKYSKLLIISNKVSEPGNDKEVSKKIIYLEKIINEIGVDYLNDFQIYRIDLTSFSVAYDKKTLFKLLNVFSESSKNFEIYC